jgi:hypothetical protein
MGLTFVCFFERNDKRIAVIFIRRKKEVQETPKEKKTNKTTLYSTQLGDNCKETRSKNGKQENRIQLRRNNVQCGLS